jgi:hypothetical protein
MRWFVDETDPPPVMKVLDEARRQLARLFMRNRDAFL